MWWELQVPRWCFQEPVCPKSCYQHQGAPWKAGLVSSSCLAEAFLKHAHAHAALGCTRADSFRGDKCKQWFLQVRRLHMDFKWDFLGSRSLIEEVYQILQCSSDTLEFRTNFLKKILFATNFGACSVIFRVTGQSPLFSFMSFSHSSHPWTQATAAEAART